MCSSMMYNYLHAMFSSAEKETLSSMDRSEKWDEGHRVYKGVWKREQGKGKEGSRSSNSVGTVSHLKKQEVERNVTETSKDGKERKETFWEHPNHQNAPKKHCLSEAPDIALHLFFTLLFCGCYCHLQSDAFVHSVRPRKDVIVLPLHNDSLWYFAKEMQRSNVHYH